MKTLTVKEARNIADTSFGYVMDCILGYSDSEYTLKNDAEDFHDNFCEDLEERGIKVTQFNLQKISKEFEKIRKDFEKTIRKKYYKKTK